MEGTVILVGDFAPSVLLRVDDAEFVRRLGVLNRTSPQSLELSESRCLRSKLVLVREY